MTEATQRARDSQVVVMLATQRSGTQLLRSMFTSHPELAATGEILHPNLADSTNNYFWYRNSSPELRDLAMDPTLDNMEVMFDSYIEHLNMQHDVGTLRKQLIVDVKYTSVCHFTPYWQSPASRPHFFELVRTRGIGVLHVVRTNVLATHCSALLARANQNWSAKDPDRKINKIKVDAKTLRADLEARDDEINLFRRYLDGIASTEVHYEDLLDRDGKFVSQSQELIARCFGVDNQFSKKPGTFKAASRLRNLISNLGEVEEALEGTAYQDFLR